MGGGALGWVRGESGMGMHACPWARQWATPSRVCYYQKGQGRADQGRVITPQLAALACLPTHLPTWPNVRPPAHRPCPPCPPTCSTACLSSACPTSGCGARLGAATRRACRCVGRLKAGLPAGRQSCRQLCRQSCRQAGPEGSAQLVGAWDCVTEGGCRLCRSLPGLPCTVATPPSAFLHCRPRPPTCSTTTR